MARRTDRGRPESEEDRRLWERATRDVRPLDERPGRPPEMPPPPAPAPEPAAAAKPAPPALPPAPRSPPARPRPSALGEGQSPGVDRRTAERLRRGLMPLDGRVDLHGMTQEQAHRRLLSFLADSASAGRRCVLVITGRGSRSPTGEGVIRTALPHWLNLPEVRPLILSYTRARPEHGGGGAFYVLLRRRRGEAPEG